MQRARVQNVNVGTEYLWASPTVEEARCRNPSGYPGAVHIQRQRTPLLSERPHPENARVGDPRLFGEGSGGGVHTAGCLSPGKTRKESTRRRTRCLRAPDSVGRRMKLVTADLQQRRYRSEDRSDKAGSLGGRTGRDFRASNVERLWRKFGSEREAKLEELARASGFNKTPSPRWSRTRLKTTASSGLG